MTGEGRESDILYFSLDGLGWAIELAIYYMVALKLQKIMLNLEERKSPARNPLNFTRGW